MILSGVFFFLLLVFVVMLASSLLSFDQGIHDISYEIFLGCHCLASQILLNFIACRYAERLTTQSFAIADIVYESIWYDLPNEIQKYFILIIQRSHVAFHLHGFQIINVSMEKFLEVRFDLFFFK